MHDFRKGFLPMLSVMVFIGALLLREPDFGALVVITCIAMGILCIAEDISARKRAELFAAQVGALGSPIGWPMGAQDVRDLQGTVPHGGGLCQGLDLRIRSPAECLQRADDLAQNLRGHLNIPCGSLQLLVPQHHLNHPDVDLLFQQVGGKAVP